MSAYAEQFKKQMVRKMLRPGAPTPYTLSKDVNVPYQTLTRWLKAAKLRGMTHQKPPRAVDKSAAELSPAEKLSLVRQADGLGDAELGVFLRKHGLHEDELRQWRKAIEEAALAALGNRRRRGGLTKEERKIRELKRELAVKNKALADHATLLALKKRPEFAPLWADEDDDIPPRNGR